VTWRAANYWGWRLGAVSAYPFTVEVGSRQRNAL